VEPRGRLLGNRYELLVPLASGGMGRVWRARDTLLERPVAVKVLRSEYTGDPTFRARFRAEAQHTAALHHPNIASVFDYGELEEDGEQLAYLVMELVEGEPLSAVLERQGRLSAARTLDLLRQTSAALAAAHAAGVVHRDVKPGNVLVGTDGSIKITDFGIAWSASSVPLTGTGQVVGTAHYLSPEQAAGNKATPASDVYALGTLAYECLTGRRAFDGENSVQIALKQMREEPPPLPPEVPAGLRSLVERAMAKDPAARFPDGAALRAAIDATTDRGATTPIAHTGSDNTGTAVMPLAALPFGASPGAGATAATPRARRVPVPLILGAFAALVVLAVLVGVVKGNPTRPEQPAAETTSTPSTVRVVAAELLGRPAEQVQAELVEQGLSVQLTPVVTPDATPGTVVAVQPEGELAPGTPLTLTYAVAPPAPAEGNGNEGGGNGNEGRGNGNEGRGNGDEGRGDGGDGEDDD
jgi:serine/threonine-protein kinase